MRCYNSHRVGVDININIVCVCVCEFNTMDLKLTVLNSHSDFLVYVFAFTWRKMVE